MASWFSPHGSGAPYQNAAEGPVVVQGKPVPGSYQAPPSSGNKQSYASPYNHNHGGAHISAQDIKPEAPTGRPCRDFFWAILFYAHLATMGYLAIMYAPQMVNEIAENVEGNGGERRLGVLRFLQDEGGDSEAVEIDPSGLLVVLCIASVLGFVVSSLALGFMISFAEILIKFALWFNIILFGAMALLSLLGGAVGGAMMCGLMCAFSAYYAYKVWSRIPFAAANLVAAVSAVRSNLGLAFYAYTSLVVLFMWSVFWSVSAISTIYVTNGCNAQGECDSDVHPAVVFAFLISYYWTIQIISNVVHVTTSGTVGTWWFTPDEANGCCSKAVRDSYVRSITTSFGSICFGSLIVAIIQAVKEMVHSARENGDSALACCADCLLGCIESLVEYFNKWAFVYVGLYGFSFMEAGSNVMNLFRSRGWTAIITDVMVDTVLFMVSIGVGVLTGILAVIAGAALQMNDAAMLGSSFLLGFFIGYGMCATLFSVVSSAVNTVIVCYAEAPNEFQMNHPELSARMREAWRQAWPAEFNY